MEASVGSDMGLGLGLLFGALGVGGALVMLVAAFDEMQVLAGMGFAAAMVAGTVLIAALHLAEQPR
ncbi:hypothetical protein ACFPYI_03655 [Halomarina salina]|uniref:Major facilitator superfamily (MFS) profile domain-containing protein n=1 Tax=Halomarina salina TaxID=1872699 RepID=A0ABD5RIN6_9EURY|nr:hypothetical protein [Halomarina salina]